MRCLSTGIRPPQETYGRRPRLRGRVSVAASKALPADQAAPLWQAALTIRQSGFVSALKAEAALDGPLPPPTALNVGRWGVPIELSEAWLGGAT